MSGLEGGKLIHRVKLQSRVESSRDSDGGINESWTTDETFWASVTPVSGLERQVADQLSAEVTHTVERRYKAGITPKNRLQHDIRADLTNYVSALGTPWTTVGSASAPFTADMVGQYLTITAGANWTTGDYEIIQFVNASTIVVDSAVASQNVANGSGYVSRILEIVSIVAVEEEHVTTEMRCVEKTA